MSWDWGMIKKNQRLLLLVAHCLDSLTGVDEPHNRHAKSEENTMSLYSSINASDSISKLPQFLKPTHYNVLLYAFNFELFTFSGDVSIRLL